MVAGDPPPASSDHASSQPPPRRARRGHTLSYGGLDAPAYSRWVGNGRTTTSPAGQQPRPGSPTVIRLVATPCGLGDRRSVSTLPDRPGSVLAGRTAAVRPQPPCSPRSHRPGALDRQADRRTVGRTARATGGRIRGGPGRSGMGTATRCATSGAAHGASARCIAAHRQLRFYASRRRPWASINFVPRTTGSRLR